MGACVLYFAINWLADNPQSIDALRQFINSGAVMLMEKGSQIVDILLT
jgi:hypothetical protein